MLAGVATETQVTHWRRLWLYAWVSLIVLFLIAPSLLVIPLSFSNSR
jgi:putative spermidine/putrescine transport system permease protein